MSINLVVARVQNWDPGRGKATVVPEHGRRSSAIIINICHRRPFEVAPDKSAVQMGERSIPMQKLERDMLVRIDTRTIGTKNVLWGLAEDYITAEAELNSLPKYKLEAGQKKWIGRNFSDKDLHAMHNPCKGHQNHKSHARWFISEDNGRNWIVCKEPPREFTSMYTRDGTRINLKKAA